MIKQLTGAGEKPKQAELSPSPWTGVERAPGRRAEKDTDESISADEEDEALIKRANQSDKAEDEPIRCASPPCYLSEIED